MAWRTSGGNEKGVKVHDEVDEDGEVGKDGEDGEDAGCGMVPEEMRGQSP